MMYIAGETVDPIPETVILVEDIVRDQVRLLVRAQSVLPVVGPQPEAYMALLRPSW